MTKQRQQNPWKKPLKLNQKLFFDYFPLYNIFSQKLSKRSKSTFEQRLKFLVNEFTKIKSQSRIIYETMSFYQEINFKFVLNHLSYISKILNFEQFKATQTKNLLLIEIRFLYTFLTEKLTFMHFNQFTPLDSGVKISCFKKFGAIG